MSVNGITTTDLTATKYKSYEKKSTTNQTNTAPKTNDQEVIYEPTKDIPKKDGVIYQPSDVKKSNKALIAQLKADSDARISQMRGLVESMMTQQGSTIGKSDDMWKFLAKGDFTVDALTKANAQADIAEDGYWGVSQTSDRMFDFAKAIAGDDPEKMLEMEEAFKKGFEQATKTWGGKLPEISQQTYNSTLDKFSDWREENTETEEIK